MPNRAAAANNNGIPRSKEPRNPAWVNVLLLVVWLLAGAVVFLPFALNTSPWDAVTLRVPGHQGNWWHLLVGAPFFLAYPIIWLRLRSIFSDRLSTPIGRRLIWVVTGCSIAATASVEVPFLLHLAGTSEWQRLSILALGLGIAVSSGILLFLRRRHFSPTRACLAGLNAAYLANAALCLVVYAGAAGGIGSKSGWLITIVIVWPMLLELIWLFIQTSAAQAPHINPRTA